MKYCSALHGQSKDALAKTKLGAWEYDIVEPYYKCNMTDIMAAIGLGQMRRYGELLNRRGQIVKMYTDGIANDDVWVFNHITEDRRSSMHLCLVRLSGKDRSSIKMCQQQEAYIPRCLL